MIIGNIKKNAFEKLGNSFYSDNFVYLSFCYRIAYVLIVVIFSINSYFTYQQLLIKNVKPFIFFIQWIIGVIITLQIPYVPYYFSFDRKAMLILEGDKNYDYKEMLYYYKKDIGKVLSLHLLKYFYLYLWHITIIGPFIKFFSYRMANFIKIEHMDWTANQCITESRHMMDGNKWKLFCLYLSFIGWILLSILTLGAIYPFVSTYIKMCEIEFYNDIKHHRAYNENKEDVINNELIKNDKQLKQKQIIFILTMVLSVAASIGLSYANKIIRTNYYKKLINVKVIEKDNLFDKLFTVEIEKDGKWSKQILFRLY